MAVVHLGHGSEAGFYVKFRARPSSVVLVASPGFSIVPSGPGQGLTDDDAVIDFPKMGALHPTRSGVGVAVKVGGARKTADKAVGEAARPRGRRGT